MADSLNPSPESAEDVVARSYNDVAYSSFPDATRHPNRLATIGTLMGLDVAPLATCRVLEFACGDGLDMIPIAATLPDATFVGFDFAAQPIARARQMVGELGLSNVQLLQLDMREVPADLGRFDYIIAHGLYSWIPAEVRAHMLPLVARHLAPNGVAFVSYNTLPGCHMRRAVWEMLRYHTRNLQDMPAKLTSARSLLKLVAGPVGNEELSQQAMRAEARDALTGPDSVLAHDDMSEPNDPVYFHEFMADVARAGLTFLSEARLSTMMGGALTPEVRQALRPLDRLSREQYLDFLHFRRFRETLLCHANALTRFVVQPSRVLGLHMHASLNMRRAAESAGAAPEPNAELAAIKQLLLARWPNSIPVTEFAEWRRQNATPSTGSDSVQPTALLVAELYVAGLVDLRTARVAVAAVPGERPEAFSASRWINRFHEVVPTLYHEALRQQDPRGQKLLALLDGTRTRDDLVAALGGAFADVSVRAYIDGVLATFARRALLVR